MADAGILVGWTRAFSGKEMTSLPKFGEFLGYCGKLQAEGHIDSFEPWLLEPHGGDLNGFILVRGDRAKLNAVQDSDEWRDWMAFGIANLAGFGVIHGHLGARLQDILVRYGKQF